MNICWLASYPKSGNTWVRFLLHEYLFGTVTDTPSLTRRIPDLHNGEAPRATPPEPPLPLLVKVHSRRDPSLPYMAEASGAVYVTRHPRDVLLSCLHYMRMTGGLPPEIPDEMYARRFIAEGGDPWMTSVGYGTWDENVASWTSGAPFPVLTLRYEDLKKDAAGQLTRVLDFLAVPTDPPRIAAAVAGSSFDRMRALEVQEKSSGKAFAVWAGSRNEMRHGQFFMNKGQAGRTLASIAPGLDALLEQRFEKTLRGLGY